MTDPSIDARRSPDTQRLAWARNVLGVSQRASPAEVRTLLLPRLGDVERQPSRAWRQAARLLGQLDDEPVPREDDEYLLAVEHEVRRQVEEYAAGFFDLPTDVRTQQWTRLYASSAPYPAIRVRLQQLKSGLLTVVDRKPRDDSTPVAELCKQLPRLFLLPPSLRDASRQELIRSTHGVELQWAEAAKRVRSKQPELAALDRELVLTLINRPRRAMPGAAEKKTIVSGRGSNSNEKVARWIPLPVVIIGVLVGLARIGMDHPSRSPQAIPKYELKVPDKSVEEFVRTEEFRKAWAETWRKYEASRAKSPPADSPWTPEAVERIRQRIGPPGETPPSPKPDEPSKSDPTSPKSERTSSPRDTTPPGKADP